MRILIIEDEQPAAERLETLLRQLVPGMQLLAVLRRVDEAIDWFTNTTAAPELIFTDVQLPDGLSFQIFNRFPPQVPVIFVTAFDQYALDAFRVNGIDYLLKPINVTELDRSLQRARSRQAAPAKLTELGKQWGQKAYKSRFMVKLGEHLRAVSVEQILLFYAEGRTVFLYTTEGRRFIVDFTLDQLEDALDPARFYRINRSFVVALHAIQEVVVYSSNRLRIVTQPAFAEELIVSREKVGPFKTWYEG